jgi:hypothetical protein
MGRRLLVTALGLAVAAAGCSGTPLGERLSASFPPAADGAAPQATPAAPPPRPAPAPPQQTPAAERPPAPAPKPASPLKPEAKTLPPAPYRLTLRLPAADPAAPAEAVTEALRAAGVSFEVERIEQAAPVAPTPVVPPPAPASSQPAPPPR